LPQRIYDLARQKEREGDFDGAGENYILFLNSTSVASTPERSQAETFLLQEFNIRQKLGATTPTAVSSGATALQDRR